MRTMNDRYKDSSSSHECCPVCEYCKTCGDCECAGPTTEVEQLRTELAASREREARMRKLVGFLLIVARTAGDAMPETHARIVSEAEAALAEGAQG